MNENQKTYQEAMEAQLAQWSTQIDELKNKALNAQPRAKLGYYNKIEDVRIKENALRQKLGVLKESGGETWEEIKSHVDAAAEELRQGLTNP